MADTPVKTGQRVRRVDISCIIATHDRDELLEAAIASIAEQSVWPREIIVSDNLARDKTRRLVAACDAKLSFPVRYIGHRQGGRGCISRNLAAEQACGRHLAFLDDDDLWEPDFLDAADTAFADSGADAVYVWINNLYPNGELRPGRPLAERLSISDFVIANPGSVISNLAVKREVFLNIGGFDEAMHPPYDRDFAMRLLLDGRRYAVVPRRLVRFRQHDGPRESRPGKTYARGQRAFFERYRDKVRPTMRPRFWLKMKVSVIRAELEPSIFLLDHLLVGFERLVQRLERKRGRAFG